MKKIIFFVIPIFLLIFSCNTDTTNTGEGVPNVVKGNVSNGSSSSQSNPVKELPKNYPQSYLDAKLPVWGKAKVDRANKIQNTEAPRYQVILTSSEDLHDIATYYNTEMKKLGWMPDNVAKEGQTSKRRTMSFKKENQQIMMNVLVLPNEEKKVITIMFPQIIK